MINRLFLWGSLSVITPTMSFSMENNTNQDQKESEYKYLRIDEGEQERTITARRFYNKLIYKLNTGEIKIGRTFFKSYISAGVILQDICDNRTGHELFFEKNDAEKNEVVKIKTKVRLLNAGKEQYNVIFFNALHGNVYNNSYGFLIYKNVVRFLLTDAVMKHETVGGNKHFSIVCVMTEKTPQEYFRGVVEQVLENINKGKNETPQNVPEFFGKDIIRDLIDEISKSAEKARENNNKNKVAIKKNKLTNELSNNNTQAKKPKNTSVGLSMQSLAPFSPCYNFNFPPSYISQLSRALDAPKKNQLISNVIDLNQNIISNSNNFLRQDPLFHPHWMPLLSPEKAKLQYILNQEDQGIDDSDSEETLSDEK